MSEIFDDLLREYERTISFRDTRYDDQRKARTALVEYVTGIEAELARLREAARWIPVEERLPEREKGGRFSIDVSVVTVGRRVTKAYCNIENRRWIDPETEEYIDITHWRALPEPPEVE